MDCLLKLNSSFFLLVKPVLGNLDNKYVKEGENVTWTCDVRKGQPPPMKISWTKDGDYITNEPGKLVSSSLLDEL